MGFSYIKSKVLTCNAFSSFCSNKFVACGASNSRFMPCSSTMLSSSFTRFSVVPVVGLLGVGGVQHNIRHASSFLQVTMRFYHAKLYGIVPRTTKPIPPINWSVNVQRWMRFFRRNWVGSLLFGAALFTTICCARIQRVPYSGRFHLALIEKIEDKLGEYQWQKFEKNNKERLFPLSDPRTIRVQSVATNIISAMNSGLRLEHECKINGSLLAVEGSKPRQKQDRNFIWKPSTKHLRRRNWEVYVVDTREKNASCLLGGRIVIYKGLLDTLKSDAELATVIGHEVGHAVARHIAEAIVRLIWILAILIVAFCALLCNGNSTSREDANDGLQRISALFSNFISRRREAEADYIGLMLMASAGYNPQVAPRVFEKKIGGKGGIDSTHPSGINRAKVLNEPKVMNKALVVYKEVKAGEGVRSFV